MQKFLLGTIQVQVHKVRRAKRLTLSLVKPNNVRVTIPYYVSFQDAYDFVQHKTDWIHKVSQKLANSPKKRFTQDQGLQSHKDEALILIKGIVQKYEHIYPFSYKKIFIKNLTSRWGSCSTAKNLNFNYRLVFLPQELAEYVVVHELCHLREMNHGPKFWSLIAKKFPHYKSLRKQLREYMF